MSCDIKKCNVCMYVYNPVGLIKGIKELALLRVMVAVEHHPEVFVWGGACFFFLTPTKFLLFCHGLRVLLLSTTTFVCSVSLICFFLYQPICVIIINHHHRCFFWATRFFIIFINNHTHSSIIIIIIFLDSYHHH